MDGTMNITAAVAQPHIDQIHIPTRYEFSLEIGSYWYHMGWVGATSEKPPEPPWWVCQIYTSTAKPKSKPRLDSINSTRCCGY